jgi:hypothetical protein
MAYKTPDYWVFGLYASSGIVNNATFVNVDLCRKLSYSHINFLFRGASLNLTFCIFDIECYDWIVNKRNT